MRMMIRYRNGLRAEAVLLAANSERMRVAIDSQRDTMELHRVDGCWRSQRGAAIEIEALIPIAGTAFPAFCAAVHPAGTAPGSRKPSAHALQSIR